MQSSSIDDGHGPTTDRALHKSLTPTGSSPSPGGRGTQTGETEMAEEKEKQEKTAELNIRLSPVGNSDQPVLANFTRLNGSPGVVFLDFGFFEPAALSALSRLASTGGKIPETLTGK